MRGLDKTYVVGGECELNVKKLLTSLCTLRQLLNVSMGPDEEKTMIDAIRYAYFHFNVKLLGLFRVKLDFVGFFHDPRFKIRALSACGNK